MPFGPRANVNVGITAQPQQAAQQTKSALENAIAAAFKSKVVQNAIASMIKAQGTAATNAGSGWNKVFAGISKKGQQVAKDLTAEFEKVRKAADNAFKAQAGRGSSAELQTLSRHLAAVSANMTQLANASRQTFLVVEEAGRAARAAARSADQASRDATNRATQSERLQIASIQREAAAIRASGEVRRASISAIGQITLQTMRTVERAVSGTFRGLSRIVSGFTRSAGSSLRGFGTTVSSIFRGIERTAAATFRGMGRLLSTFGRGITTSLQGVSRAFSAAFRRDENELKASLNRREAAMRGSQSRMASLLSPGGLGLLAGGAGVGSLLTSGFERFGQQEQLQLTFQALLRDGPRATAVLSDISDFARTTSFDFVEVASSVAQLTASLGDVDQAFDMTKFLSDIVALTGGTTESLGRVRLAMTQIASAGRLDSANLRQLTESLPGVPFAQILADKFFGGDVAAYAQARDAGELGAKITAEAFFNAFQEGVQTRFPEIEGFAQTAATTVTGLTQNLKENFAIFGATIIGLAEGPIKGLIDRANEALGVLGDFVKGTGIFGGGGGPAGTDDTNPYRALAQASEQQARSGYGVLTIPFEELPQEMQDILHERNGWGPNEGFVLAAEHAAQLWDELHPPPDVAVAADTLRQIRDIVFDFAKGSGVALGLAASLGVLRLAISALLQPFTLFILGAGLLGVAFGQIYDASEPLRDSIRLLGQAFGPLVDSFKQLGGSLLDAFFRFLGADDTQTGLQRVGGFMSEIVNSLTRGVAYLSRWISWMATMIDLGHADAALRSIGFFFRDINTSLANFIGGLIGITPEAIEAKGGGIVGLLRNTFLEPVVNFFTDTLPDAVGTIAGYISGFFSEIWEAWTGGGSSQTAQGITPGPGGAGIATGRDSWLAATFLDPVVNFFHDLPGHVADIAVDIGSFFSGIWDAWVSGSGGRVGEPGPGGGVGAVYGPLQPLWDSLTNFKNNIRDLGLGDAFGAVWDGITESASNIWTDGLKPKLDEMWQSVQDWFADLDWGAAIGGATIAAAIGLAVAGLPGLVVGTLAGFLGGGFGLFDPLLEIINNAWDGTIKPALDRVWKNITNWFSVTFTAGNLENAGVEFLGFVQGIGEKIGSFFGSPEFQAAVGGALVAAAAGTAILASFTQGLIVGLSGAFLDWAELIAGFLNDAWDNVEGYLDFVPDPILNAIDAMFTSVTAGATTLLIGATLGPLIVKSVLGGITQVGPALVGGAGGLVGMIFGKGPKARGAGPYDQDAKVKGFRNVGTAIAGAIVAGIVTFDFSRELGQAGGQGNLILGLLTGTVTGAALGFSIGGGLGAAIGAGLGAGTSALGLFFGNASRQAQEAKARIQELQSALEDFAGLDIVGGLDATAAERVVSTEFRQRIGELGQEDAEHWGQSFVDNINFDQLAQQALDSIPAENALVDYIRNLGDEVVAQGEVTADQFQGVVDRLLQESQDTGVGLADLLASPNLSANAAELLGILDSVGVSSEDLFNILGFLATGFSDVGVAQGNISWDQTIEGAEGAADSITTVGDAVDRINELISGSSTAREIAEILNQETGGNTELALDAVKQAAQDVESQMRTTRDAIVGALQVEISPTTLGGLALDFVNEFKGIENQLEDISLNVDLSDIEVTAANQRVKDDVAQQISSLIQDGLDNGTITSQADAGLLLQQIRQNMTDADLSPEATTLISGVIDDLENALTTEGLSGLFDALEAQLTEQGNLDRIGTALQTGVGESFGGEGLATQLDLRAIEAINKLSDPGSGTSTASKEAGQNITKQLGEGFGEKAQDVVDQGELVAAGVIQAVSKIVSPVGLYGAAAGRALADGLGSQGSRAVGVAQFISSAVTSAFSSLAIAMYLIGVNAGASFARGVVSQVGAAASAAAQIAAAAAGAARRSLKISSPSRVFAQIGTEVGRGFIQGIRDSEGDMADGMSKALEGAIETAIKRTKGAVERAQASGRIFELLAPSLLPGGTTKGSLLQGKLGLFQDIAGFGTGLRSAASGALGDTGQAALAAASATLLNQGRATAGFVQGQRQEYRDAQAAQQAIEDYDKALGGLNYNYKAGYLGVVRYNEQVAELKEQLASGRTSLESYKEELKILGNELRLGILNQQEYEERLGALGDRPGALTYEQMQILRSGPISLDPRFAAGLENRQQVMESLDAIKQWGQEALNAGQSIDEVIAGLKRYRKGLLDQLETYGFSETQLAKLADAAGLSDKALEEMRKQLTSLNQNTVEGAANVASFLDRLTSIREFGQRMLESGVPLEGVIAQIKAFRDQLVDQAVSFGFNAKQIEALVKTMGLSDQQLKDFTAQLARFNQQAKNAEQVAKEAAAAARKREEEERRRQAGQGTIIGNEAIPRPRIQELHVHVPTGDPEAVALVVGNRLAYERVGTW